MSIKDLSLVAYSGKDWLKNDRISELPDDILICILSSLTLKEAGSTSVLSKRWRHVSAYVPSLKFDCGDNLLQHLVGATREEQKEEEPKYFRWVEQVVNSYKAHTIDEFMIRYDVDHNRKENIDSWLTFAMEKRVKRLQLNIKPFMRTFRIVPYTLPTLSFSNTLTSLKLCSVEVSGEVIEKFLCDCPALESLSVERTKNSLIELKVVGSSLNLKSLKLWFVRGMKRLEISAPNLISFHYAGPKISWPLISTPKLVTFSCRGFYGNHILKNLSELSNISSHIEVLSVYGLATEYHILPKSFPIFRRLKTLDFRYFPASDVEVFRFTTLLKCCPLLNKLALEYSNGYDLKMTKKTRHFRVFCHQHLKIFEFRGFMGCDVDVAFILFLTKSAVSMEKLIVNTGSDNVIMDPEKQETADKEANRLGAVIKPGLQLEIRKTQY